jgi:NAD+ kinase
MREFKTVAIVGRYETPDIVEPIRTLVGVLFELGYHVSVDWDTADALGRRDLRLNPRHLLASSELLNLDVGIVIGGDGTMLGFGREASRTGMPLIGVNRGRVGFITDIPLSDMFTAVPKILSGEYEREDRAVLSLEVSRSNTVIYRSCALNDVTVTRGGISGMVELSVHVDGQFMYNQRSDGLIIATPTGSSAYSLAAGGPLLHPRLRSVVITPVAPQKLSNRPIVLPGDSRIDVRLEGGNNINVHSDMQTYSELRVGDLVTVTRSSNVVPFLHPKGHSHYSTLREKLHWNE